MQVTLNQLNPEQRTVYDLVIRDKKNIFITSRGGCGKSTLLNLIHDTLKAEGYATICVAFTGRAASLLPDGTTASRCVGMRNGEDYCLPQHYSDAKPWKGTSRTNVARLYNKVDPKWAAPKLAVFIDEIGQLSSEQARLFYELGMRFRWSQKIHTPPLFVMAGDFGQFKPVQGSLIFQPATYRYWETNTQEGTITLSTILDEIKPEFVKLTQVMRQTDERFLRALSWAYYGITLHPIFAERIKQPTPVGTPRIFFNNSEVVAENEHYINEFLKRNPKARSRTYSAICTNLSDADRKYLLPVQEEMKVYEGMPFTITVNVADPDNPKQLLVANGDVVTVTKLNARSIVVEKANGEEVELIPVQHHLPPTPGKKQTQFKQLPGYTGPACSAMRVQGQTFDHPVEYGVWQWAGKSKKRMSLRNQPGAFYVFVSRNTRLEDIYFDTSFGMEEAERLIRESIVVDDLILEHLLEGKPPFWRTDPMKKHYVIELLGLEPEPAIAPGVYRCIFHTTYLPSGEEKKHHIRYQVNPTVTQLAAAEETETGLQLTELRYADAYRELAVSWILYKYSQQQEFAAA